MEVWIRQLDNTEFEEKAKSLLTPEEKERYINLCQKIEDELRPFEKDVEVVLYFPFGVTTTLQAEYNPRVYPGLVGIAIGIYWRWWKNPYMLNRVPIYSEWISFDIETGLVTSEDYPIHYTDCLEQTLRKIKNGKF